LLSSGFALCFLRLASLVFISTCSRCLTPQIAKNTEGHRALTTPGSPNEEHADSDFSELIFQVKWTIDELDASVESLTYFDFPVVRWQSHGQQQIRLLAVQPAN